jgi:hypothetical protein
MRLVRSLTRLKWWRSSLVEGCCGHLGSDSPWEAGVPGLAFTLPAVLMWVWTLHDYSVTRFFSTNLAVVSMAATSVGFILMTTAMIN